MTPLIGNPATQLRPEYDRDHGQAGLRVPREGGVATLTLVANRGYAVRFVPSRAMSAAKIAFLVATAAGANDAVDVGIYDSAFNRLASAGATTGKLNAGSPTVQTVNLAVSLQGGKVYYAAISSGTQGGTAGAIYAMSIGGGVFADIFGTAAGVRENAFMDSAHPLPATFVPGAAVGTVPILAVRES